MVALDHGLQDQFLKLNHLGKLESLQTPKALTVHILQGFGESQWTAEKGILSILSTSSSYHSLFYLILPYQG